MQILPVIIFVCVFFAHGGSAKKQTCDVAPFKKSDELPFNDWKDMRDPCINKMKEQVQIELTAAMTYMAMGAHFARDTINRPGFSKIFFESASEEREHAIKIISYLLMRGELTVDIAALIKDPRPDEGLGTIENGVDALNKALKLEAKVTNKVRDIIKVCENPSTNEDEPFNDYHLVDYLTADFLEEQYNGQRDLAGKIQTLGKMMETHGPLGEFLFDKKLLNGSPL